MKVTYDKQADALYFEFKRGHVVKTTEITEEIAVDFDSEGNILGIEVLEASHRLSLKSLTKVEMAYTK